MTRSIEELTNSKEDEEEEYGQDEQQQQQRQEQQQRLQNNDTNKFKRNPYCSRCRNHGKNAQVKGHKRHCEYRDCQCEGCRLVEARQLISAAQIRQRRHQRQDEESGRRIKVSPPVLKREPKRDPIALISKALIGTTPSSSSSSSSSLSLSNKVASQIDSSSINHTPTTSEFNNSVQKHLTDSIHHQQTFHQLATAANHSMTNDPATAAAAAANLFNAAQNHYHNNNNNVDSSHLQLNLVSQQQVNCQREAAAAAAAANSQALNNALHLFHFPNSMLSSLNSSAQQQQHIAHTNSIATTSVTSSAGNNINLSTLPSSCEQINLVEEIHEAFGPLAIYAWLRAEQFDLQKVRNLIEISRIPYNNLLDLKSKYCIKTNNHQQQHNNNNNSHQQSSNADNQQQTRLTSKSPPSTNKIGTTFPTIKSPPLATNLSSSPYAIGSSSSSFIGSNGLNDYNNAIATTEHLNQPHQVHHNNSATAINNNSITTTTTNNNNNNISTTLATTLNSIPIATSRSLIWPNLKLTTSGSGHVIRPHPLLPHFMNHHEFVAHQLNDYI